MGVLRFPTRLRVIKNADAGSDEQVIGRRLRSAFRGSGCECPKVVVGIERKRNGEMEQVLIFIPRGSLSHENVAEAVLHPGYGIASVEEGRAGIIPVQGLPGEPQEDAPLYWQVSIHECGYIEGHIDVWRDQQQET